MTRRVVVAEPFWLYLLGGLVKLVLYAVVTALGLAALVLLGIPYALSPPLRRWVKAREARARARKAQMA